MSTTHALKTLPVYFAAVLRGDKTFEVRKNDRDFQTGDAVVLREYDPKYLPPAAPVDFSLPPQMPTAPAMPGGYTGKELSAQISYVLHDTWNQFGIERGFVVFGLEGVEETIFSQAGESE